MADEEKKEPSSSDDENAKGNRKRSHDDDTCIGGCGNPPCKGKMANNSDANKIDWWFVKLESATSSYESTPESLKYDSTWSNQNTDTEECEGTGSIDIALRRVQKKADEPVDRYVVRFVGNEDSGPSTVPDVQEASVPLNYSAGTSSSDTETMSSGGYDNPVKFVTNDGPGPSTAPDYKAVPVTAPKDKKLMCKKCIKKPNSVFCKKCNFIIKKDPRKRRKVIKKKRTVAQRKNAEERRKARLQKGKKPNETNLCTICEVNTCNTAFIHEKIAHLCACYKCARRIYYKNGTCPICGLRAATFKRVVTY